MSTDPQITDEDVDIRIGLRLDQRHEAARLFYEAFHDQLRSLLPTAALAEQLLYDDFDIERVIVAVAKGRLVGFAGMSYGNRNYCTFDRRDFITRYGWIAGPVRYMVYAAGVRPRPDGELVVDGLGVTEAYRRRGVGARLLNAICDFARDNGFRAVRLEVADTNLSARRLYLRTGFVDVRVHRLPPFVARAAGYSALIEMRRALG